MNDNISSISADVSYLIIHSYTFYTIIMIKKLSTLLYSKYVYIRT